MKKTIVLFSLLTESEFNDKIFVKGKMAMTRQSGVLMHLSSLWGDYSSGSMGKSGYEWIDFLSECRFKIWQVLPFCVTDSCNSPYKSFSAFSLNPFFIDLDMLYEDGLLNEEEICGAKQTTPYSCEFDRLKKERMKLLFKASERFEDTEKLNEFFERFPQSENFCRFMGIKKANGEKVWNEWESEKCDEEEYKTWRFTQYIFYKQWMSLKKYANEKGISVIGDIPIYVDFDSADVWANPSQFLLDEWNNPTLVAGVPPDYFCKDGQLWGNPIYNWDKMKEDGYSWWKERLSFMCELFDGVRIDHFRGIESYYCVKAGSKTARDGEWRCGPGMDFINEIKKVCRGKFIIAEDLGEITDAVLRLVEQSGFPGMRVLQFGFFGDMNGTHIPHNYIKKCVAYTGTHDNNTLLGYVWEMPAQDRKRLFSYCGYDGDNLDRCYDAILKTMFQSHADTLILPLQDLLLYGSDTRLNTPGKSDGNWQFRITREQLSEIDKDKFKMYNYMYGRG